MKYLNPVTFQGRVIRETFQKTDFSESPLVGQGPQEPQEEPTPEEGTGIAPAATPTPEGATSPAEDGLAAAAPPKGLKAGD